MTDFWSVQKKSGRGQGQHYRDTQKHLFFKKAPKGLPSTAWWTCNMSRRQRHRKYILHISQHSFSFPILISWMSKALLNTKELLWHCTDLSNTFFHPIGENIWNAAYLLRLYSSITAPFARHATIYEIKCYAQWFPTESKKLSGKKTKNVSFTKMITLHSEI